MDLCESEASLAYSVSSKTTRAIQRNPVVRYIYSVLISFLFSFVSYLSLCTHIHTDTDAINRLERVGV